MKEANIDGKARPTPRRLLQIHKGLHPKILHVDRVKIINMIRALTPKPPLNRDHGPEGPSQTLSPANSLQDWIFSSFELCSANIVRHATKGNIPGIKIKLSF